MICKDCNTEFKPFVHNQTRCRSCVAANNIKEGSKAKEARIRFHKNCEWCNTEYTMTGPASRYCSTKCSLDFKRAAKYKLSYVDFTSLLESKVCHICGSSGFVMDASRFNSGLVIDHCHTTGEVRGMLCHNCNRALGLLQDDTALLRQAISYLERATTISKESTLK
jgi:hypothetical protein